MPSNVLGDPFEKTYNPFQLKLVLQLAGIVLIYRANLSSKTARENPVPTTLFRVQNPAVPEDRIPWAILLCGPTNSVCLNQMDAGVFFCLFLFFLLLPLSPKGILSDLWSKERGSMITVEKAQDRTEMFGLLFQP